jgi:hypothetical protein
VCFKREFQNVKASIILKQVCQPAKHFTQSFARYTFDTEQCVGNSGELVPEELESLQTPRRSSYVNC